MITILKNERTSAFFAAAKLWGCLLVSYSASSAAGLALFSVREVSAARVAMGSSRMRLASSWLEAIETCSGIVSRWFDA